MRVRILWRWGRGVPDPGTIVDVDDTPENRSRIRDGHAEEVPDDTPLTPLPRPRRSPAEAEAAAAGYGPEADADDGAAAAGYADDDTPEGIRDLIAGSINDIKERLAGVDDPAVIEAAIAAEKAAEKPRFGALSALSKRLSELT